MMREEEKQERFRSHLLRWYAQEGRRLPWREHITPYRTWVSEIMLQQTRVEAVIPYFERFITTFPCAIWLRPMMICYIRCGKAWAITVVCGT